MEEKVELCGAKLSSSYEMPLVIIKDFESVIKGYHAYMNGWIPILGENATRPEPENETDKYAVPVTKDARVIGHLKQGKTGRYAKTVFYFLQANPMGSFKKYVRSKLLVFDPPSPLFVPVCFACTLPPPSTYVRFNELPPPLKKSSATLMTLISNKKLGGGGGGKGGEKREKN